MPDLFAPKAAHIRDPKDNRQENGKIHNPPRYMQKLGGLTGPGKIGKSAFKVEKPVKGGR